MKKRIISIVLFLLSLLPAAQSQVKDSIEVFFLTCDPGTEVYSVYGHSAIRILNHKQNTDLVYNWGIFDFATPNFVWKFSKGRLDYMVGAYPYSRFLDEYTYEERSVYSQKVNLNLQQSEVLIGLINDNLLPENVFYRYDFFYDNCATRIRDLFEKSVGLDLYYPVPDITDPPTFREMLSNAQKPLPWLNSGINLLIGLPGDKKASFRDRMFLPGDLMKNLSLAETRTNGITEPLLQSPVTVLDFAPNTAETFKITQPMYLFLFLLAVILLLIVFVKKQRLLRAADIILFSIFALLSVLMVFFTFFTDHLAMKMNMNIIWLNPFLVIAFLSLFLKINRQLWFRIVFFISLVFLCSIPFIPQSVHATFIPLILIIIIRAFDHSGFKTNLLPGQ